MLEPVTRMRWLMHQVSHGVMSDRSRPVMNSTTWTFQRSCAAYTDMVDSAISLKGMLPGVITALHAVAPQLSPSCISASRDYPSGFPKEMHLFAWDVCVP